MRARVEGSRQKTASEEARSVPKPGPVQASNPAAPNVFDVPFEDDLRAADNCSFAASVRREPADTNTAVRVNLLSYQPCIRRDHFGTSPVATVDHPDHEQCR